MIIGGIRKTTLIDYPGRIASMVFTRGCTFACPWCHNGTLLDEGESISTEDFFSFLESRKKLIDGVVVSGGEPTIHGDIEDFLARIRETGLAVKLDTNGSLPQVLERILDLSLVDYVAMDVKAPLRDYGKVVGVDGYEDAIKKSISLIMERAPDYEFRTTFVPGLHNQDSAAGIGKLIEGAKAYYLQYFRPVGTILSPEYRTIRASNRDELEIYSRIISPYVKKIECRI